MIFSRNRTSNDSQSSLVNSICKSVVRSCYCRQYGPLLVHSGVYWLEWSYYFIYKRVCLASFNLLNNFVYFNFAGGYTPQQVQQYWSQMQQSQHTAASAQQSNQPSTKTATSGTTSNTTTAPPSAAGQTSGSNQNSTQPSGSTAPGYNTQGYNTQGYNTQGYDANAYAQYCAYYSQLAAQSQGWTQVSQVIHSFFCIWKVSNDLVCNALSISVSK